MKITIILITILCLFAFLCGCGGDEIEDFPLDDFVGSWKVWSVGLLAYPDQMVESIIRKHIGQTFVSKVFWYYTFEFDGTWSSTLSFRYDRLDAFSYSQYDVKIVYYGTYTIDFKDKDLLDRDQWNLTLTLTHAESSDKQIPPATVTQHIRLPDSARFLGGSRLYLGEWWRLKKFSQLPQ